jgi:hypothetical protein
MNDFVVIHNAKSVAMILKVAAFVVGLGAVIAGLALGVKTNSATGLKTVSEAVAFAIALGGIIVGLVLAGIGYIVSLLVVINESREDARELVARDR